MVSWALESHKRSYEYYAESITYKPEKKKGFYANSEKSIDQMSLFGGIGLVPKEQVLFEEYLNTE